MPPHLRVHRGIPAASCRLPCRHRTVAMGSLIGPEEMGRMSDTGCQQRTCRPPSNFASSRSPLLVWVKNVILCGHGLMADMPAIGAAPVGRERVGRGAIVEQCVSPSAAGRKSHVIFFDEEKVFQGVRHIYGEGGVRTLFRRPLDL